MKKANRPSTYPGYELPTDCDYPLIKTEPDEFELHVSDNKEIIYLRESKTLRVLSEFPNDNFGKVDASMVLQAVNTYQSLKDSNAELIEIAKQCVFIFGNEANYPEGTIGYNLKLKAESALQKVQQTT